MEHVENAAHRLPRAHSQYQELVVLADVIVTVDKSRHNDLLRAVDAFERRRCDGKTVYARLARLEAREMSVEPLPNKTLVRDLVTEIAPSDEEL